MASDCQKTSFAFADATLKRVALASKRFEDTPSEMNSRSAHGGHVANKCEPPTGGGRDHVRSRQYRKSVVELYVIVAALGSP